MLENPERFIFKTEKKNGEKNSKNELNLSFITRNFQEKIFSDIDQYKEGMGNSKKEGASKEIGETIRLKLEGEEIYRNDFIKELGKILEHKFIIEHKKGKKEEIILKKIIEYWLEKFSGPEFSKLAIDRKSNSQKEFLENLTHSISKISPATWSIDFKAAIETNHMNCQCCSALTGLMLESVQEITEIRNVEYGFPVDHAVNIATLANNEICLIDSRRGVVEVLKPENTVVENYKNLKIYKIKNTPGQRIYQIIPVLPLKEGILTSYLGNLCAAYICTEEKIPEIFKKYINPKELKKLEDVIGLEKIGARQIYGERNLSEEKASRLAKIREVISGGLLEDYKKTEEFQNEIDRCREIYYGK